MEINDNMLEQFPEAILQISFKNTRQEVKSLVQVTHGMLSYHFIPLRVKKGLSVQVASLVQCLPLSLRPPPPAPLTSSHILMPFKCHLFYMRQLVET